MNNITLPKNIYYRIKQYLSHDFQHYVLSYENSVITTKKGFSGVHRCYET